MKRPNYLRGRGVLLPLTLSAAPVVKGRSLRHTVGGSVLWRRRVSLKAILRRASLAQDEPSRTLISLRLIRLGRKKTLRGLNYFLIPVLIFCIVLAPAFSFWKKKPGPQPTEVESVKKTVAVISVQKAFPGPLYLSIHPPLFTALKIFAKEKKFTPGGPIDYDPRFVPKMLNQFITDRTFKNGYLVFIPEEVGPQFDRVTRETKEFPMENLSKTIPADGFLLMTLTQWDAESFDRTGTLTVGFDAVLVDAKSKRAVWSNKASGLRLKTPGKDTFYSKYQKDLLNELADRILKGFPKKSWQEG